MKYGLTEATVENICTVFARFPAIENAVLYGSRAKGNFKTGSDIDLTLCGEALTSDLCATVASALDDLMLPYTIDLSVFDELNNKELREHIERVGVVFYERAGQGDAMKKGWQTKKLGEICEIERGGSPRPIQNFITTDTNGINWIKISDATASDKYIYKTEEKIKPEGGKRSRMVYEGDFILSNSMSFGRPYIMKTTGCIHDGWLVLHQPKVDPDYLYYVLGSDLVFNQFDRLAAGSTVRNLNIGLAKSVEIPYPPLPEQQRIVGILDEALEGIATAKSNAEKNLQNARALFESHLQSVFTRRGEGWADTALSNVCGFVRGPFGGSLKKSIFVADGYAVYEQQHAIYNQFDNVRYFIDEAKFKEMIRFELLPNDLIMSCSGTMGRVAIVPKGIKRGIINQALLKLTPTTKISCTFLKFWMESEAFQDALKEYSGGAAIQNVASVKILKEIRIPLPSIKEQERVVNKLDALSAETQRLEAIYKQKLAALEALKKSLLHQAFSGHL